MAPCYNGPLLALSVYPSKWAREMLLRVTGTGIGNTVQTTDGLSYTQMASGEGLLKLTYSPSAGGLVIDSPTAIGLRVHGLVHDSPVTLDFRIVDTDGDAWTRTVYWPATTLVWEPDLELSSNELVLIGTPDWRKVSHIEYIFHMVSGADVYIRSLGMGKLTELPVVTVSATDSTAQEPSDPGLFTFTRSGPTDSELTVGIKMEGTASPGADYAALGSSVTFPAGSPTATRTVTVTDDTVIEDVETVIVTIETGTGYTVGSTASATVEIKDNDTPKITILDEFTDGDGDGGSGAFSQVWGTPYVNPSGWHRAATLQSSGPVGMAEWCANGLLGFAMTGLVETHGTLALRYTPTAGSATLDSLDDIGLIVNGVVHDLTLTLDFTIMDADGDSWTKTVTWPGLATFTREPDLYLGRADLIANGTPDWTKIAYIEYVLHLTAGIDASIDAVGIGDLPPAATLSIARVGDQVRIAWPSACIGYTLERHSAPQAGWSDAGLTVKVEGAENAAYERPDGDTQFYRLRPSR